MEWYVEQNPADSRRLDNNKTASVLGFIVGFGAMSVESKVAFSKAIGEVNTKISGGRKAFSI